MMRVDTVMLSAGTSASSLSSAQSLPGWVMDAKDIEILTLSNGKPFLLGSGSFGTVYKQSVAVKKITQADDMQMTQFIKVDLRILTNIWLASNTLVRGNNVGTATMIYLASMFVFSTAWQMVSNADM